MEAPITNKIYQMSERVYDALTMCASNNYHAFAVLEPKETDIEDPKRRKDLLADLEEIKKLQHLGLLKDISSRYQSEIAGYTKEHGFSYKVVELTKESILMFANSKNRVIN